MVLLGVNIDHVATVRNARGGLCPDPSEAALVAEASGADGITVHLREDRRHIRDGDLRQLRSRITTRLNLEMANTPDMVKTALRVKPDMVTLVPEKRQELTTEGGLDVSAHLDALSETTAGLMSAGIPVSLFVAPDEAQLEACLKTGAPWIELHTGAYAHKWFTTVTPSSQITDTSFIENWPEWQALLEAARWAEQHGIKLNAGHGLNYDNVESVLSLPGLVELNIGHSIIAESIFTGLSKAVKRMKNLLSS
jgi:pyridoxine 5-phosphate synthase